MTVSPLDEYVRRVLAAAPPLSVEQRDRLALILRPQKGDVPLVLATPKRQATTVYRHFDTCGCLLYIGIAYDAVRRSYAHAGSSWWTKWTDRIEMDKVTYDDRAQAMAAEREFISNESPVFNKVHAPDRDGAIIRYLMEHERWEHLAVPALVSPAELPDVLRTLARANLLDGVTWTKEPRS